MPMKKGAGFLHHFHFKEALASPNYRYLRARSLHPKDAGDFDAAVIVLEISQISLKQLVVKTLVYYATLCVSYFHHKFSKSLINRVRTR